MRWRDSLVTLAVLGACGPTLIWSGRSDDRQRRIEIMESDGLSYLVTDGQRGPRYRGISVASLRLSGSHVAFAARLGRSWTVVLDGMHGDRWDNIGEIVLTRDGRIAYAAQRDGTWRVVAGGIPGPHFESILASTLQFDPSGRYVAYVGARAGRVTAVIDGRLGPSFDGIGQLTLGADGRVAYAARRGLDAHVVIGEQLGSRWSAIAKLQVGPSGRVIYAASDGSSWRVVVDGIAGPAVDSVNRILVRNDGAHVAWVARYARLDVLALNGVPIAAFPAIDADSVTFRPSEPSGNGVGLTYVTREDGARVVVDDVRGARYDDVGRPVWSARGALAYAARRGDSWCVVVDGVELVPAAWVGNPVFSSDGQRMAYVRRNGKAVDVVVDGRDHRFDFVFEDTLTFSADGLRWGIVGGDLQREKLFIALDGSHRVDLPPTEIYSAAARGAASDDILRRWTQIEVEQPD